MEFKLCEMLHVTPKGLGEIRRKEPESIAFLERYLAYEIEVKEKQLKEAKRKAKAKPRRRR
jgi:hypothetical protein